MIDRKVILKLFLTTIVNFFVNTFNCFLFIFLFLFLAFAFDLFVLSLCLNVFQCVLV